MQLEKLREIIPFKWRVQSSFKTSEGEKLRMIAYVDARDVQMKLDEVCKPSNWQDKYYQVKETLFCSIGICIDGEWVWKSDAGTESRTEGKKGESSDAFKRAAVKWGVNRDAYSVGMVVVSGKTFNKKSYPCDENGKFLKGKKLNDYCNQKAKIEEMDNYLIQPKSTTEIDLE